MNLRTLNAYVASALGDWGKAVNLAPSVPRSFAPMPDFSPTAAAGASSFGMSGTNAYALAKAAADAPPTNHPSLLWNRSRYVAESTM